MTTHPCEWSSYLPDGRPIRIRRLPDGRWHVVCEQHSATGRDLSTALTAAIGLDAPETVHRTANQKAPAAMGATAREIEREKRGRAGRG